MLFARGKRRTAGVDDADLSWVYGAAVKAASDAGAAGRATFAAMTSGAQGRRELMAMAVREALADSPANGFASLPAAEREAIGLARIVGLNVDEIAALTGCERALVKARMLTGLRELAGSGAGQVPAVG